MTERRAPEVCARRIVAPWADGRRSGCSITPVRPSQVSAISDGSGVASAGRRATAGRRPRPTRPRSGQRGGWSGCRRWFRNRRRTPSAAVRTPVPARRSVGAAGRPQDREDNEGDPVRRELAPPRTDPVQMAPDEAGDQVQGRGVRSTASLASLRPVPVVARYRLIAWILRPGPVRPVGNARGVEEHDEDDKRQCCDSLGREPSSLAFARSGSVCTNLSGRPETRKRHAG